MTSPVLCRAIAPAALALVAFSLAPAALAAGNHAGGHGNAAGGQPGQAAAASRTVEVIMHDNYYVPETIAVRAGETVRFVVRNAGQLVHEFNLGTPAMHAQHQAEMQMMVEHGVLEADRINRHMMNVDMGGGHVMSHDHANSVLLEPGQSGEIIWTFPADATVNLEFACNVPGHYEAGMQGQVQLAK
jgi:uncharacterized cupredoxin-like copper-binding protein